jgi:hypothetical protein
MLVIYCIFSRSMFVIKNVDIFILNSGIHNIHTRYGSDLHYPRFQLAEVQKSVFYSGLMIFNNVPQNVMPIRLNMT